MTTMLDEGFKKPIAKPNFIKSKIVALLMDIQTNDGKIKYVSHNLIKDVNLAEYRNCDLEDLKSMITIQIPDHTEQQFKVLCDLAWYGSDYQLMLSHLMNGSNYVSDFRGKFGERAFEGQGSNWIIGQYAMSAMKAERLENELSFGPHEIDWSRIVAAYLKTPGFSDDFAKTGLSVSELLCKCNDEYILEFLQKYGAVAEDQSFDVVYKWEHLHNPERIWTNLSEESMSNHFMKAVFRKATPESIDVLAVLRNGFVIEKITTIESRKAA